MVAKLARPTFNVGKSRSEAFVCVNKFLIGRLVLDSRR